MDKYNPKKGDYESAVMSMIDNIMRQLEEEILYGVKIAAEMKLYKKEYEKIKMTNLYKMINNET